MSTFERIRSIFYGNTPYEGSYESIQEIAFLVDKGYLALALFPLADKKEYKRLFDRPLIESPGAYDAAGGGDAHIALKLLGARYLKDKRGFESQFEQPFCGYFPDVISRDKSIIIECGVTGNPEKMLACFRQSDLKEFIQLPYPYEEDAELIAYNFAPGNDCRDFLKFLETEKLKNIKSIINRKK